MDKKFFSERLYDIVMDLLSSRGAKSATDALDLQENYFAPSKYNLKRFKGKAISHLDQLEAFFGIDLLGGAASPLAKEIEKAEADGALSMHDRKAIRSVIQSAREHADRRGSAAVSRIKKSRRAK